MGDNKKPFVNDKRFKELLLDGIIAGKEYTFTKTTFYDYLKTIVKIDKKRSFVLYDKYYNEIQTKRQLAKINIDVSQEEEQKIKAEIGTKFDRLKNLRQMVDDMKAELKDGQVSQTKFIDDKPAIFKRPMTQTEKNLTRKTIKEVQAEISKIEGDYAEIKVSGEINNNVTFTEIEALTEEEQLILLQADKLLNKR